MHVPSTRRPAPCREWGAAQESSSHGLSKRKPCASGVILRRGCEDSNWGENRVKGSHAVNARTAYNSAIGRVHMGQGRKSGTVGGNDRGCHANLNKMVVHPRHNIKVRVNRSYMESYVRGQGSTLQGGACTGNMTRPVPLTLLGCEMLVTSSKAVTGQGSQQVVPQGAKRIS